MAITHEQKLAFVHKQTKLALEHVSKPEVQHLDTGGTVLGGPTTSGTTNSATTPNTSGIMGGINDVLGTNDNFQAGSANITPGTNTAQLNQAYTGAQNGLNAQSNIVAQTAPGTQQGLNAQSTLSNQYAAEAAGTGPNPAQAALNQSTGQNVAQTAALIAGQRGAGGNAGASAVNAAQTGAATQQGAVGQAATLQAQQALAAQSAQANLASTQVGQGATAVQNQSEQQQNEQNILQGANTSANNANVAMQSNINNANSQTSAANQNSAENTTGGILSGASSIASLFAKGGMVKMDAGGNVLDANARKHIAPDNFALPGRRYPIHDEAHARNALARVSQNGTPAEKAKVKAAVSKKYPNMGVKKMADGGDVDNGDDTPAFSSSPSDASSGPSVASSASLPASTTNYAQDINKPSSPGGGGGGGGIMSLAALMANGGMVRKMALGGYLQMAPLQFSGSTQPSSFVGKWVNSTSNVSSGPNIGAAVNLQQNTSDYAKDIPKSAAKAPKGSISPEQTGASPNLGVTDADKVVYGANLGVTPQDAQTSPGAQNTPSLGVNTDLGADSTPSLEARGGLMKSGGNVMAGKGQKAVVKGDSLKNDKIPTELSEGEIVIPRHITMSDRAPEKAAAFVAATLAKRKKK